MAADSGGCFYSLQRRIAGFVQLGHVYSRNISHGHISFIGLYDLYRLHQKTLVPDIFRDIGAISPGSELDDNKLHKCLQLLLIFFSNLRFFAIPAFPEGRVELKIFL